MGTADKIMGEDVRSNVFKLIQNLAEHSDEVKMKIVDGWTHEDTCIKSYTTERLDWIFRH